MSTGKFITTRREVHWEWTFLWVIYLRNLLSASEHPQKCPLTKFHGTVDKVKPFVVTCHPTITIMSCIMTLNVIHDYNLIVIYTDLYHDFHSEWILHNHDAYWFAWRKCMMVWTHNDLHTVFVQFELSVYFCTYKICMTCMNYMTKNSKNWRAAKV